MGGEMPPPPLVGGRGHLAAAFNTFVIIYE